MPSALLSNLLLRVYRYFSFDLKDDGSFKLHIIKLTKFPVPVRFRELDILSIFHHILPGSKLFETFLDQAK